MKLSHQISTACGGAENNSLNLLAQVWYMCALSFTGVLVCAVNYKRCVFTAGCSTLSELVIICFVSVNIDEG